MTSWTLITPLGKISCHKGRSFGKKVWKKPAPKKVFKMAFFSEDGASLSSDIYAHIDGEWIPSKGNKNYSKKISYKKWSKNKKSKGFNDKELGLVVKRTGGGSKVSLVWDARKEKKISLIHLHRFVTRKMKYIVPDPKSVSLYRKVNSYLNKKGTILITKPVCISKNSSISYVYGIIPIGKHLCYVEVLDEDLAKPFPVDALIPSGENSEEIGSINNEGGNLI